MSLIDKPDLKTGFWVGAGVLLAFLIMSLLMSAYYRAKGKAGG